MAEDDRLRGVEFVDLQEREYFARAKLGLDVYDFLRSPVGRYLHGCAKQEIETLRDELEKSNPDSIFGRRKVRRLQTEAKAARMFMRWLAEAIQDGDFASRQLEEYRENQP